MQLLLPITNDPIYCPPLAGSQPATLQINVLAAGAEEATEADVLHELEPLDEADGHSP